MKLQAAALAGWMCLASFGSPASAQVATSWSTAGMTVTRPALFFMQAQRPALVMTCSDSGIKFQVRGFVPAQRWPQPELTIAAGAIEHSKMPDARLIGDQTALETEFRITDSLLDSIRNGTTLVQARFNGQKKTFPAAPAGMRTEFVEKCAALVLPAMRAG